MAGLKALCNSGLCQQVFVAWAKTREGLKAAVWTDAQRPFVKARVISGRGALHGQLRVGVPTQSWWPKQQEEPIYTRVGWSSGSLPYEKAGQECGAPERTLLGNSRV